MTTCWNGSCRRWLRESQYHPIGAELDRFLAAAAELGFTPRLTAAMASQVTMRVLIQTGKGAR
jgi:hypothetical protein